MYCAGLQVQKNIVGVRAHYFRDSSAQFGMIWNMFPINFLHPWWIVDRSAISSMQVRNLETLWWNFANPHVWMSKTTNWFPLLQNTLTVTRSVINVLPGTRNIMQGLHLHLHFTFTFLHIRFFTYTVLNFYTRNGGKWFPLVTANGKCVPSVQEVYYHPVIDKRLFYKASSIYSLKILVPKGLVSFRHWSR